MLLLQAHEPARLSALARAAIVGSAREAPFDELVAMAGRRFAAPVCAINFIDARRAWPKAIAGFPARSLPRSITICQYAVEADDLYEVEDALADARFAASPLVQSGPRLRYYAGVPIKDELGYALGTFCIWDAHPRRLDAADADALRALGRVTAQLVELRRRARAPELDRAHDDVVATARRRAGLLHAMAELFEEPQPLETLLEAATQRLVPALGDGCVLDVHDGERQLRRTAVSPSPMTPSPHELSRHFASDGPLLARVRRGRAPLTLDGARGPFRAALIVPLATRGQLCGTLTLVSCTRSYTADELALALDVAHRLAGAIAYALRVTAAEAAVRARQEALAIVSHDLRNPLSTILTSTGRLLESVPDDRVVKPALERTQRAARRMMALIGDLLDAASMEGGALLSLDRHEHDIGLVLTETVDLLQPLAEARAQTLTLDLRDIELGAECDRERVMQVLSNIVGNAIKFTPRGGSIRLGAERARGLVRVWVADDGPGIAPDAIPHVFDRYWHTETRELRPGAGLGLYIAKGIVERHGGHIWVETTQGRGTTFHFTLPAAPLRDRAEIPPAT